MTQPTDAPPWDDVTDKLDALIRSAKANTEAVIDLRMAVEVWRREWQKYQEQKP